jgi:hypothetical protein
MVDKRVCQLPKSLGGLGAKDIDLWARCKGIMWTKKYYMEPQGLWQQMLKNSFKSLRLEKGPKDIGADSFLQKAESLESLPKPWPWIVKAWKSLGGGTRRPQNRNELLAHPFWSNKAINAEQVLSRVCKGALVRNRPPEKFSDLWNEALERWKFAQVENRHQEAKRSEALIQLQRVRPRLFNLQEAEAPAMSPAEAWPVGIKVPQREEHLKVEDISLKKIYLN